MEVRVASQGIPGLAIYSFMNWRIAEENETRIVFRPGARTLLWRLVAPAISAALMFATVWVLAIAPAREETKRAEHQAAQRAETERLQREFAGRAEADRYNQQVSAQPQRPSAPPPEGLRARIAVMGGMERKVMYGALAVLALFGILVPLSCLWNRVVLRCGGRGLIEVYAWIVIPRRKRLRVDTLEHIHYSAEEVTARTRYNRIVDHYWRWTVQLNPKAGAQGEYTAPIVFFADRQEDRPRENSRPPQKVIALLNWLYQRTGRRVSGPAIIEETSQPRSVWGGRRKGVVSGPRIFRKTYGSLEELPPELRAKVEGDLGHAAEVVRQHKMRAVQVGEDGQEDVYNTLEEMPPELRREVEEAKAAALKDPRRGQAYTFRDAEGNQQVYHSLAEMPPELRARVEAMRKGMPAAGITFRDAGGKVHRYASVEDMPPDVRAYYDQISGGPQNL